MITDAIQATYRYIYNVCMQFSTQMPQLFIIKICFTIKLNSTCRAGRDTTNLCRKLNSQGPALRILGLSITSPKSQGSSSRVLGVRVPVSGFWVSGSRVSGSQSPGSLGLESQGPGSKVVVLDYAFFSLKKTVGHINCNKNKIKHISHFGLCIFTDV